MGAYSDTLGDRLMLSQLGQIALEREFADFQDKLGTWSNDHLIHISGEASMERDDENVHTVTLYVSNLNAEPASGAKYLSDKFNAQSNYRFIKVRFMDRPLEPEDHV